MCGIAGVIYKDKKSHHIGDALTSMLESLQHRGPDSAGYALYGSLDFPENYYQLNIQVNRRKGTLDNLKSLLTQITPIFDEELIGSVGNSDVYKCKIALDEYSLLKPCISEIDELDDVRVINGSHSFEMIKDVDKSEVVGPHLIQSPVLGPISTKELSGGVKTLILMAFDETGKVFNASACGNNCAKWILKIAESKDLTINLRHVMDFGDGDFKARILNNGIVVNSMKEYVEIAGEYV